MGTLSEGWLRRHFLLTPEFQTRGEFLPVAALRDAGAHCMGGGLLLPVQTQGCSKDQPMADM